MSTTKLPPVMTYDQLVNDAGFTDEEARAYLADEEGALAPEAEAADDGPAARDAVQDRNAVTAVPGDLPEDEDAGEAEPPEEAAPAEAEPAATTDPAPAEEGEDDLAALLDTRVVVPVDAAAARAAVDALEGEYDAIQQRFDEGEITQDQRRAELADLRARDRAAHAALEAAESSAPSEEALQAQVQTWTKLVMSYMEANPDLKDGQAHAAFDAMLRHYTSTPGPMQRLPMGRIIERAHQDVIDQAQAAGVTLKDRVPFSAITAKAAPQPPAKPAAAKPAAEDGKPRLRTDPRPAAPQTLADLPSAGAGLTGQDPRWAAIDAMNGEEMEAAIERLSPADRAAYLRSR